MAVDPGHQTITNVRLISTIYISQTFLFLSWVLVCFQVVVKMLKEEGVGSFYRGLVPSLIGIAPYVAVNFCVFDL